MRRTFHGEAVDLLSQFQNVTLMFPEPALHPAHSQVQCTQAARCYGTAKFCLLLHGTYLFEGLLLFLTNIIFQPRFGVCNVPFKVTSYNCDFIEAIAQRVLCSVEA